MEINNILFVNKNYQKLQALVNETGLEKNVRFLPEEKVTDTDLDWADAFVPFRLKQEYDFSKVRWVHSLGAGVDHFLFKKKWNSDVLLTRTICSFGQRIGEYCLSYILKDLQFHDHFHQFQKEKKWQPLTPILLNERKVIIFGTGEIGQATAQIFSSFGVEVVGVSLSGKEKDHFNEVISVDQYHAKLKNIDYVINTLPLTERTEQMFNEEFFRSLGQIGFINVGRGASVDETALHKALDEGVVKFAVLDVFSEEPLPTSNPLWQHPNVIITPHISAVTTANEAVDCFIDTLSRIESGQELPNKVDVGKGF